MLSAFLVLELQQVSGQSKNFVKDEVVKIPQILAVNQLPGLTAAQKQTTLIYFDGLGRAIQTVAVQASPLQKDIIVPVVYNNLGQQTKSLLPYVGSDGSGSYRADALTTGQPGFYSNGVGDKVADDAAPFSQQVFENSPLQRLLKSGLVGVGFQPAGATGTQHYKTAAYRSNSNTADGNIIMWGADGTNQGNYADNTLSVTDGKNEDGVESLSFTDLRGQTVLKRQKNGGLNIDTYYIYNNAGAISYVIPPLALKSMVTANNYDPNQAIVNKLIFKYLYDDRGRVVEKTVPGAGVVYIIYDPLNRPVLIQDARLRIAKQWNYIKYDSKDHPISQGIYTDPSTTALDRIGMQYYLTTTIAANYNTNWYESRSTAASTGYYTSLVFPISNTTPLAYSYYDDYDIDGNGTPNYNYSGQSLDNESSPTVAAIKGVPTMVRTRTVGSGLSNIWLIKVLFYDKNGRLIQSQSNNQLNYTAGVITDYSTSAPDFAGIPQQTKTVKVTGTLAAPVTASVLTTTTYDHMYRIMAVDQSYNNGSPVHVSSYSYNEIGQLIKKNLQPGTGATSKDIVLDGSNSVISGATFNATAGNSITLNPNFSAASGSSFSAVIKPSALQSVDFRYNIRGQLTSINNSKLTDDSSNANTNDDSNDLFGMQFLYDQADNNLGNTAWFSGRLSAVKWMSRDAQGNKSNERSYTYNYDALARYNGSVYAERGVTQTGAFNLNLNGFSEYNITYNDGGNLLGLKRNSSSVGGSTLVEFDNLGYTYDPNNPNQLKSVSDGAGSNYTDYGFRNLSGTTTESYIYDENGNLTTDPYKSLTINYNLLNKTDKITVTLPGVTGRYIYYTYSATGQLIRKQQFDNSVLQNTTDYIDGFVYINNVLSYFSMPEGRVRNTGSGSTVVLKPEYIISDQQGNARLSFEESASTPGTALIRQENSYYGFGLVMPNSQVTTPSSPNKQLYNGGSEWQNDFDKLPDYYQTFYRNYDAALARFIAVDPIAESAESISPYNYAGNNPIMFNDPLGDYVRPIPGTYVTDFDRGQDHSNHSEGNNSISTMDDYQLAQAAQNGNKEAYDRYVTRNNTAPDASTAAILNAAFGEGMFNVNKSGSLIYIWDTPAPVGIGVVGHSKIIAANQGRYGATSGFGSFVGFSANFAFIGGFGIAAGKVTDATGHSKPYFTFNGNIGFGLSWGLDVGTIKPTSSSKFVPSDFGGKSSAYSFGIATPVMDIGDSYAGTIDDNWSSRDKVFNPRLWGQTDRGYTVEQASFNGPFSLGKKGWGVSAMYSIGTTWVEK